MIFANDDQQNKYYQVWKELFKIINGGNSKLGKNATQTCQAVTLLRQ